MKKCASKIINYFDRTQFNLATILIGGAGILTVITHFNVPELNMTFIGENPFAIKRDIIENIITWTFTGLAAFALLFQIFAEIFGENWPRRKHSTLYYLWFSVTGLLFVYGLVWLLTICDYRIAKRIWWPKIVQSQKGVFNVAEFLLQQNGLRPDQIELEEKLPNFRTVSFETGLRDLSQIEELLEIPSNGADIETRIARLRPYFEK